MRIQMYNWLGPRHVRDYRKGWNYPKKHPPLLTDIVRCLIDTVPEFGGSIQMDTLLDEFYAQETGNHVLFPETPDLVRMMEDSSFEVDETSFRTPWPFFTIGWWKELGLPGCLVSYEEFEPTKVLFDRFIQRVAPRKQVVLTPACKTRIKGLTVAYQSPTNRDILYRHSVPAESINACLSSWEAYWSNIKTTDEHSWIFSLSEEESRYAHRILRAICGLCVWISVHPELLRDGVPQDVPSREMRQSRSVGHIIGAPKLRMGEHGPVSPHWRKKHFRHLKHPRFKRNPDGSIKIIEIEGFVVKGGIPHTVEAGV